ncbi:MAG TPA: histidine phosphatase family protein [Propionibacteriaceae bacterium]|nr:histidine phosphatase family protein [Propionibacteriaceae bacterium]
MSRTRTIVHLLRHGEVENPTGVLYGRLPDYHLSEVGQAMARRVADHLKDHDLVHLRCSPLERAQETMAPHADIHGLPVTTDGRVIEAANFLEGQVVSMSTAAFRNPANWRYFVNPSRPSWGEPYREIVARMRLAMQDAVAEAEGHEALIVSHQLPIWMARCDAEGRRLFHDPRRRECTLASLTSFTFLDGRVASVSYSEPAAALLPAAVRQRRVAGA